MEESLVSGLYCFKPHERAASFVKAKLSVRPEQFVEWLRTAKVNDKGFVSIDILESRSGKWYAKKDEWVRGGANETAKKDAEDVVW